MMTHLQYLLERRPRRKSVEIRIELDGSVIVLAPLRLAKSEIDAFVRTKSDWIQRKLTKRDSAQYPFTPKRYVEGELFLYLGREYRLQLIQGKKSGVRSFADTLEVTLSLTKDASSLTHERIKKLIDSWYRDRATTLITDLVRAHAPEMGVSYQDIRIKKLKARWGSCSTRGNLSFNLRLVMAPLSTVEYVVVHELAHRRHMNHSRAFWNFVASVLPDYKDRRAWLKENGPGLTL